MATFDPMDIADDEAPDAAVAPPAPHARDWSLAPMARRAFPVPTAEELSISEDLMDLAIVDLERSGFTGTDRLDVEELRLARTVKLRLFRRLDAVVADPSVEIGPKQLTDSIAKISEAELRKVSVVALKTGKIAERMKPAATTFRARIGIAAKPDGSAAAAIELEIGGVPAPQAPRPQAVDVEAIDVDPVSADEARVDQMGIHP